MAEDEIREIDEPDEKPSASGRPFFTRRNAGLAAMLIGIGALGLIIISLLAYRVGFFDTYLRTQFTARMAEIGIVFDADVFEVTASPLELHLVNATFNNRVTGEKLFFIRDARLGLSVQDVFAWQLSRDIQVDTTDINGAEIWIIFDENGKSNFAELEFVEQERGYVNFKYDSVRFTLRDAVVHFGDVSRTIAADANNFIFNLAPEDATVPPEDRRYLIETSATDSRFVYDGHPMEDISVHARGVAYGNGSDVTELRIETPVGTTTMSGKVTNWERMSYDLNVESSVDLTQTSNTFPLGTTLRGVGNFKGRISGEGERYNLEGTADSQALSADGVYLKAVNVNATVAGTNSNYEGQGQAVAELLTFADFRIEFPRIAGNIRGTGTDFRWVGELQAAAARSGSLTIGGLFLSDAVAEKRDQELAVSAGNGRAQRFAVGDVEIERLYARNLRYADRNGGFTVTSPNASADGLKTPDYQLDGLTGRNLRVDRRGRETSVNIDGLAASGGAIQGNRARNVRADSFTLIDRPADTSIALNNVRADEVTSGTTRITGVESPRIEINNATLTTIYSDTLRVASIVAGGVELGSLNIGGVRLTIREGRVEGRTNDVDTGTIAIRQTESLPNGGRLENVKIVRPVFVVEPSGRYRASADMSIGGGVLGSIPLGNATASVNINYDRVELNNLNASVMNGSVNGRAVFALNQRTESAVDLDFSELDLAKVLALQGGRVFPVEGKTTGRVDLRFRGTDLNTATGTINANITADAGTTDRGTVPINGRVEMTGTNGLFSFNVARLTSPASELGASGRLDLRADDSDLRFELNSTDASEIDRIFRGMGLAPDVVQQLDDMRATFAGRLNFEGSLKGNASDPTIDARASVDSVILRERDVGSVNTAVLVTPAGVKLNDGSLRDRDGGTVAFEVTVPYGGANNTSVRATLTNVNAGNLLAALPVSLPERIRDFTGRTSGTVDLTGLPNAARGNIDIAAASGTIAGHSFDSLRARADFDGTKVTLTNSEIRIGEGRLTAMGQYDRGSTAFNLDVTGNSIPLPLAARLLSLPETSYTYAGLVDLTARASGEMDRPSTYDVQFSGSGRNIVINQQSFGTISFKGTTVDNQLRADLTVTIDGRAQELTATADFRSDDIPVTVFTDLENTNLTPFLALVPQLSGISVTGTGTGRIELSGNVYRVNPATGQREFTSENLSGFARLSRLALQIEGTPLTSSEPVSIRLSPNAVTFEAARFEGGGSNVTLTGTKALTDSAVNDLSVEGRMNLSLLNAFRQIRASDMFFGGLADVSVRFTGTNRDARVTGSAVLQGASVATFIGDDRLTFDRLNGRVLFASNQVQIDRVTGNLGGGEFTATGGLLLQDDLTVNSYRVSINGRNVTVPYPPDFSTTGDASIEISGNRVLGEMSTLVTGNINARRSLYTRDIELANVIGARREASLAGPSTLTAPRFDLTIEGRNALVVQNNIADLTASVSLRVTGTADDPQISGRIVANSGQIFFRNDRYDIQRGVLEFPPDTAVDPVITLQAETEIAGYQIFVSLNGPLSDTELMNASVRSSPALPQADVVSLITTGSLANTSAGIPTLAQTGINTAAEVLTDAIINDPVRKATDRLFGLNVFEIDPIVSGQRANPYARLTVGRQINNNLRVTYSTNLSQDQNQVLAFEYRVSNKLSLFAQYEQRSLSNVTSDRDNFSFGIRIRRRF